jgi:hypothetical protein
MHLVPMCFFFSLVAILCYSQSDDDSIGRFSHIWLQAKYENKNLKTFFSIFGYLLERCINFYTNITCTRYMVVVNCIF